MSGDGVIGAKFTKPKCENAEKMRMNIMREFKMYRCKTITVEMPLERDVKLGGKYSSRKINVLYYMLCLYVHQEYGK